MNFIADFHIHSHFSIATSKDLIPEYLDYWARLKGIKVVGTGDFTHPGWLAELQNKLEPAEQGLFRLKEGFKNDPALKTPHVPDQEVRFILTSEISSIYKKFDKVRKVHNVIFAPDFDTVEKIQQELSKIGNITSDGRPILGLDSRDLLEIALNCSDQIFFVPAHIWTPWFSALGAKSGFDTIEECYGDLSDFIFAVETGLSSDPPMNWMCSFLDKYTLISNSDAHSPEKLGREANLFDTDLSYNSITESLKNKNSGQFLGTVEFFPQEGKYHFDGHRKCGIVWDPVQTLQNDSVCPECGKKVTTGVLSRVVELSDREHVDNSNKKVQFFPLVPLKEILGEIAGTNPNTKKVKLAYNALMQKAGTEFNVLMHWSLDELKNITNDLTLEAIRRMRAGEVFIKEGFDGEYGQIKVFDERELKDIQSQSFLFSSVVKEKTEPYQKRKQLLSINLQEYQQLKKRGLGKTIEAEKPAAASKDEVFLVDLNTEQLEVVKHFEGPALIIAGPGTGKTKVLTNRIAYLINKQGIEPRSILAVTFTNKAAREMKDRLNELMENHESLDEIHVSTFHALGYKIINDYSKQKLDRSSHLIVNDNDKRIILHKHLGFDHKKTNQLIKVITKLKQNLKSDSDISDEQQKTLFIKYQDFLSIHNLIDLDDLIYLPVQLFNENPKFLAEYRNRFRWLLVDEYQDINFAQYNLIRMLTIGDEPNLCVIGDPNQAIYGFRGADVQFIKQFKDDYPSAKNYNLSKSYRCSENILQASANIITSGQKILHGLNKGVKITISQQLTDKSEAEFVARTIEQMMGGLRFFSMDSDISEGEKISDIQSLSDFAVLCRIKRQIPAIEKAFFDHSIPFQTVSESHLFENDQAQLVMDVLKFSQNQDNRYLELKLLDNGNFNTKILSEIVDQLKGQKSVYEYVQSILEILDVISDAAQTRLLDIARNYKNDLQGFMRFGALGVEVDTYLPDAENVAILTLHAAKGLEFKCVFIVGCEEGLLPYTLFKDYEADISEERRLLYVGMTRTQKYLYMTHTKKRFIMGREFQLTRSPFLDQIEQELLEFSKTEYKKPQKKDNGQLSLF